MKHQRTILIRLSSIILLCLGFAACTSLEDIDSDMDMQSLNKEVFEMVDQMPEFPEGQQAMLNFLKDSLNYPLSAQKAKVQGRVVVSFIVDQVGNVMDITINEKATNIDLNGGVKIDTIQDENVRRAKEKGIQALKEEALRVVALMPKWQPGEQEGKPVAVEFNMPIRFRLRDSNSNKLDPSHLKYLDETFKYMHETAKYPEAAAKVNAKGQVSFTIIINKDGSVSDFEFNEKNTNITFDDISTEEMTQDKKDAIVALKEETLRVVQSIPHMQSERIDGKSIKKRILFWIDYNIVSRKHQLSL